MPIKTTTTTTTTTIHSIRMISKWIRWMSMKTRGGNTNQRVFVDAFYHDPYHSSESKHDQHCIGWNNKTIPQTLLRTMYYPTRHYHDRTIRSHKDDNDDDKTRMKHDKPKAIFLNSGRLNYDYQLDFRQWDQLIECTYHHVDHIHDVNEIIALIADHEIVIMKEMSLPTKVIEVIGSQQQSLQLICEAGTGYNNIPIQLARQYNITVCNTPTYSTDAVAHLAVTYLMNFSCSMFSQQAMLVQNDRRNFTGPFTLPLHELNGKILGLIGGSGKIGTKVAQIGLVLGMKIIISSRNGQLESNHILYNHPDVICTNDISYLLQQSDYVSLHTPLNEMTRQSFGKAHMEQMKSTAFLINTSRGGIIHEEEFIACMKQHRIAGAGLDVTTHEPPHETSPLWNLSNVYLSPHIGWRRCETRQRLIDMTTDNIYAYCHATSPKDYINVVN
jgi:glycerate dehydrogenase